MSAAPVPDTAVLRRLLFLAADPLALHGADYYVLLGVPETADESAVRAACRDLLVALDPTHPPAGLSAEDKERGETLALLIADIEETLCDAERREAYDARCKRR